ncbi:hypothetical protein AHAS_Ahas20G0136100 [Arachis hypogaea]
MSNNLYCLLKSGERRALGLVVELGLENMVDIIELHHDLILELKRKKKKMEKKTVKKESMNVRVMQDMMEIRGE